jgi:ABC-type amino acid transport substrate-binding protein
MILFLILCALGASGLTYFLCTKSKMSTGSSTSLALLVGLLCATVLLYVPHTSTPEKESEVIIVGTSGDFPPFTQIQSDGTMTGFDIDLIQEIGTRLHKKIELKNMPFATLLPSLQLGSLQVIASGLTETPERAKQVLFSTPYLENNPLVMVSLNSLPAKTLQDLNGQEVIVNDGYTADLYLSAIPGPLIKRLKSPAEAFLALKTGRAFAFVTARNTVQPFFEQYGAGQFHVAELPNTEESASLAIAPQYPMLRTQIQSVLDGMKEDGSLQKLKHKWGL